ncbi:MAG: hypothetical protein AAGG46_02255, partial [Planctomycetota bacterium]
MVLPCQGIYDFPTFYQGADAEALLAAWSVAWRPRLLAAAGRAPEIICSYELPDFGSAEATPDKEEPDGMAGALLLVPDLAIEEEVRRWIDQGNERLGDRWLVVESFEQRGEIISAIERSAFAE